MNCYETTESSEEKIVEIIHKRIECKMRVKQWLEIQLILHKRKDSVQQWLDTAENSVDLYKKMCDLNDIEWIELQYFCVSLKKSCVIIDDYARYTMEEIMRINRILKKISNTTYIRVRSKDKRILFQDSTNLFRYKISMSCKNFEVQKYIKLVDILQEGENLICYFDDRKKAMKFLTKCMNNEEIYYLKMEPSYDQSND